MRWRFVVPDLLSESQKASFREVKSENKSDLFSERSFPNGLVGCGACMDFYRNGSGALKISIIKLKGSATDYRDSGLQRPIL